MIQLHKQNVVLLNQVGNNMCSVNKKSKEPFIAGSDRHRIYRPGRNIKQRGFVLVLALVLLAVMTLIGISSMNSANMELRAAANAQHHQVAFNAVQSVLEFAISDAGTQIIDYQDSNSGAQVISTHTVANTNNLSASAAYTGCSIGIGSSMEEGKGVRYNFLNITGTGTNKTGTAKSVQVQGVRHVSAACK